MTNKNLYQYDIFPFEKVVYGSEIILYGFGKVGKRYIEQLRTTEFCNVKCIIDRDYEKFNCYDIPVYSPNWLRENRSLDIPIIVSVKNDIYSKQIVSELIELGIDERMIISKTNNVAVEISDDELREASIMCFSHEEIHGTKEEQIVKTYKDVKKHTRILFAGDLIRVGNNNDGGYVMLDSFESKNRIAYSFGIAEDVSWDLDMARRGYDIYMYDPTISDIPIHNDRFHFFRKGIAGFGEYSEEYQSLERFISDNRHEGIHGMILKMDVEGAEYGFLKDVKEETLLQFDQMIFEFHNLLKLCGSESEYIRSIFSKICKTHVPIHVHANNWDDVLFIDSDVYPNVIEVTYARRDSRHMKEYDTVNLPNQYDQPCWKGHQEIILGSWN